MKFVLSGFIFSPNRCTVVSEIKLTCDPLSHNALMLSLAPVLVLRLILAVPNMMLAPVSFIW